MLTLCLLLAGVVTLDLEGPPDLSREETAMLEQHLLRAIEAHPAAAKAVGERLRWSVDVGATRIQILAERLQGEVVNGRDARVGSRDVHAWAEPAAALIEALYGKRVVPRATEAPESSPLVTRSPPRASSIPWAPVLLLGTGAAALIASVAFGASSISASNELGAGLVIEPDLTRLQDRSTTHGAISISMAAGAVVLAGLGVWLLAD